MREAKVTVTLNCLQISLCRSSDLALDEKRQQIVNKGVF